MYGPMWGTFFFDFVFNSDPRDEDEAKSLSLYQTDSGRYPSSQQYHSGTRPMGRGVVFPQKIVRLNNPGMEDIYFGGMVKFLFVSIFENVFLFRSVMFTVPSRTFPAGT